MNVCYPKRKPDRLPSIIFQGRAVKLPVRQKEMPEKTRPCVDRFLLPIMKKDRVSVSFVTLSVYWKCISKEYSEYTPVI